MIEETITGNTPSSITNPTSTTSDVVIGGSAGTVLLEVRAPNGEWALVNSSGGAYSVSTSDPTLDYRFRPVNVLEDVHVYFGP